MQLITGRKAVFETKAQKGECIGLVSWFCRIMISRNKDAFFKAIDPALIDLDEELLANVNVVAKLACKCCLKKPAQRPDMGHVVNVLSSLIELRKPSDRLYEEGLGSSLEVAFQNESPQSGHSFVESVTRSSQF